MSARPQVLSQIVSQGAEIRPGTDPGTKADRLAVAVKELQLFDCDLLGLEFYRLAFSRQSMSGNAGNFLGGKWWRVLSYFADELRRRALHLLKREFSGQLGACWLAFSVVSISGPAKTDNALIALVGIVIKLRQTGKTAQNQRQDAGRHRIKRAEMPNGFFSDDTTHPRYNIMRGHASRFVDD